MASIAETFWGELLARLTATPGMGIPVVAIKRDHRTVVTRQNSPAVHLIEGEAKLTETKACDWTWKMDATIRVFVRDDLGLAAADPYVCAIVARVSPEAGAPFAAYSNGVRVELVSIAPETEIADEDATAVNVELAISFGTGRWAVDVPFAP